MHRRRRWGRTSDNRGRVASAAHGANAYAGLASSSGYEKEHGARIGAWKLRLAGPALLVYFMLIGMSPRALVQTLNFCFIAGKSTQIVTWTAVGGITLTQWLFAVPWIVLALVALPLGRKVHLRISPQTYTNWLRWFLWAMVVLLLVQFARLMLARG